MRKCPHTATTEPVIGQIVDGDIHEWTAGLPPYQRTHIEHMLESQSPTEVAISWLTSSGPKDTAPFGGVRVGAGLLYGNLSKEMQKLLCGTTECKQEREALVSSGATGKLLIVGIVSTAVAPHVGAAAAVIGPAVAMVLAVLSSSGKATICEGIALAINEQEATKGPPAV